VAPGLLNPGKLQVIGCRKRPQWEIYLDGDCGLAPDPQSLNSFPKGTAIMPPNRRRSRFLPGAFGICAGVLLCAWFGDYLFNLVPILFALGVIARLLEPFARRRGWGSEGRLTRHLSRPPLIEESKRLTINPGQGR
jgi:hypothetical protein